MTEKKYVRLEPGERVDQPDMQELAAASQRNGLAQLGEDFLIGSAGTSPVQDSGFVVRGFFPSNPSGKIVRIEKDSLGGAANGKGVAIMGARIGGQVVDGLVMSGGESTKEIDITSFAVGSYGIYIRFEFRDDEFVNRNFWDPNATPAGEFPRNIPTRTSENWAMTVELVSPGPEWIQLGTVDQATMAIVDERDLFFEGNTPADNEVTDDQWGGGLDRSISREVNGVFGLRRAIRGLQRQVQDILGGSFPFHGWWPTIAVSGGRSLNQIVTEKLARDGSQTMQGDLLPDGDGTRDLGSPAAGWRDIFLEGGGITGVSSALTGFLSISAATFLGALFVGADKEAFGYASPQTFTKAMIGGDFVIANPSIGNTASNEVDYVGRVTASFNGAHGGVELLGSVGNPILEVMGALQLPQGATITGCVLEGEVNTANCDIAISRVTHDFSAGTKASLMSTAAGGAAGTLATVAIPITLAPAVPFTVPVNQNLVIDNDTYKYIVMLRTTVNLDNLLISELRFTYTLSVLKPGG